MTAKAGNTTRSRCGKFWGSASAAARLTAPRMPAHDEEADPVGEGDHRKSARLVIGGRSGDNSVQQLWAMASGEDYSAAGRSSVAMEKWTCIEPRIEMSSRTPFAVHSFRMTPRPTLVPDGARTLAIGAGTKPTR